MAGKQTYEELEQRVKILEKESFERKRNEEDLKHQKRRLESLIEYSSLAIVTLDERHNIISCNQDFEKLFYFSESEMVGRNLDELIAGQEHIEDALSYTKKTLIGKAIHGSGKRKRKDGAYIDVEFIGVPIIIDGEVIGAYGIYQDISEQKRTEEALRESEEKYRLLVENAGDAIFIAQDEVIKFANPKTQQISGYSKEELAKMSFIYIIHPEDREMVIDRHRRRLTGEKLPGTYSFRIINRDNEELWVELNAVLINWEGKPATLNFLRDITAQKKLEAQLQQAQRMEAIGTLGGGVAHDFNNLLMGIQGRTSLMLMDKDSSHPDFEHLKGIEDYLNSAANLTKQLLGFARGGKYEVKPTDINEMIKKTSKMFGRTKKEIKIYGKYQKDVWTIEADQGQIEQVLMNLYVNAWQAMPGGGELYLQTENLTLDENYIKPFKIEPGKYVKISVTDTGVGMDEATRQRVFDPFFTTKEMGRGTGLGLASAYGIIKNHGGFINVYSKKGEGAAFEIYLPASASEVGGQKAEVSEDIMHGNETVLLVDDEDMIIDVGEKLLQKLGYEVLIAGSGKEATEIYEKNKDKIDMVILDMIMPDMSGGETFDRLREINPDIKVLLSSGYSINGQATQIIDRGCNGFIHKPFNMKQLSRKLREILDNE
jgi:two-component system cell cycle sensor histidine kinase/response regulator CckA